MAEPVDETPGSEPEVMGLDEGERREQGYAVVGLNALSAGVSEEARDKLGLGGREEALEPLAAAIDEGRLGVPRLLVLDALVNLARRRPQELVADDPALDHLLEALVRQAGVALVDQDLAVATVRRALDSVAQLSVAAPARHPWPTFARQVSGALRLTQAEIEKPLCNDREIVVKDGVEAVGVTVNFHTDAAPGEMKVCDPTTWHECTSAFHEMTPWKGPDAVDQKRPNGWRRDLIERVDFLPELTLETPLRFTYSIDDGPDPRWVHLDYVLIDKTDDIEIDEGAIDVRLVSGGKHAGRTRVSTKKAIRFRNELLASWPTVACDTFWTDLVVNAAVGCLGNGGVQKPLTNGGTALMTDPKPDELGAAIENAAEAARESIDAYAELAKQAAAQLSGAQPADNAAWLQLTTKAYGRALVDASKTWSIYNDVLRILSESDPGTGSTPYANPTEPPANPTDPPPDG